MRHPLLLVLMLSLLVPAAAVAQPPLAKVEKVRVGFRPYREEINPSRFKVGLWTPVFIEVTAGPQGLPPSPETYLEIKAPDSEDVETIFAVPVRLDPNESRVFIGYTKVGNRFPDLRVKLHVGNKEFLPPPERDQPLDIHAPLYLTLGRKIPDFPKALVSKEDRNQGVFGDEGTNRAVLWEDKVDLLPEHWFGYDGVDVLFLSTDNKGFLELLARPANKEKLRAITQWVRRGGRLAVPVSPQTQELLDKVLTSPVWQPALPVTPPAEPGDLKKNAVERLPEIEGWGKAQNLRFPDPRHAPFTIATLEPKNVPAGAWEVEAKTGDGRPLIARVNYGLGQVTYFAFSFEEPGFTDWEGRNEFLQTVVSKLGPRAGRAQPGQDFNRRGGGGANDLTSHLAMAMDNFDVRVIPFGYVAMFIILYVLIVGPLDFIILKYVFKRLEWTWITFPSVVIAVSIFAYFTAYALKGQELKINKLDVIDFDLRTDVDAQGRPRSAHVYGRSFFTILSPRIQSYTIGIEPNPLFWGAKPGANPASADVVSWMGRPDSDAFGMGRGGGQGFFRKPYQYAGEGSGLVGVPIPVWTTKAFDAAWELPLAKLPFTADLVYRQKDDDVKITGKLLNHLAVDLFDVWLLYDDQCFPIEGGLPAARGEKDGELTVKSKQGVQFRDWINQGQAQVDNQQRPVTSQGVYDPSTVMKQLLFHSRMDNTNSIPNHSQRRLDLGWRINPYKKDNRVQDRRTREAILYARVRFASGSAEPMTAEEQTPLPTKLWLGDLPDSGRPWPGLAGHLNQDTYVRVLLPIRP